MGEERTGYLDIDQFIFKSLAFFSPIRSQVLGVQSDVLFPVTQQRELETLLKEARKEGINFNCNLKQDLLYYVIIS